jgi:glyoxylate reductase
MKVAITRKIPGPAGEMLQKAGFDVVVNPENRVLETAELKSLVREADGILCLLTDKITGEIMDAAGPRLKIIANYAVGYDNIDITEAKKRNIFVTNTPGGFETAVAEHAVGLMLAVARRIVAADKFVRANEFDRWDPNLFMGGQMAGKTLGIIGPGRIGTAMSKICEQGLGMKVITYSRRGGSLEELLKNADVISLHVPLTDQTRHMIGAKELSLMKKTAILINTARGAVVEEAALARALREEWIAGAGLDVFEDETKLVTASEKILYGLDNVVLTPHIASATGEARAEMSRLAAENILAALSGKTPANLVL